MFPEYIVAVLQQLSYLALIIIAPCTVYNTVQNITNALIIKNHIDRDDERFARINKDIGTLYSSVNDAKVENMSKWTETIAILIRGKGDNHA